MHALASHLHTSVAAIERGMSAQEFARWQVWMHAEQVGPAYDRLRHAELMAAVHNGACSKVGGGAFGAADFMAPDPWQPSETSDEPAAPADKARIRAELKRMEAALFG